MRRLTVAASSLILAGCVTAQTTQPPQGPTLVIDVTNASDREVVVATEFDSPGSSGNGESLAAACRREATPVFPVTGDYRVSVDGEAVADGVVQASDGTGRFLVIRVFVGPDGDVEAAAPVILASAPDVSSAIPGCGQ
jgi:hypothetical protein